MKVHGKFKSNLIPLCNSKGRSVGLGTKSFAKEAGLFYDVVQVFLVHPDGRILLQQRAKNINNGGKWNPSAQGKRHQKETCLQTAKREIKEELSLRNIPKLHCIQRVLPTKKPHRPFYTVFIGFLDDDQVDEIDPNPEEVQAIRWVTLAQAEKMRKKRKFPEKFSRTWNKYHTNRLRATRLVK